MKIVELYNIVLLKSRDITLYKSYDIKDNLQNKILLLLIYFSFIFNKLKENNLDKNQKIFDYIFLKIETDLREIGFGDMSINKKMKELINIFYSILLNFDNFSSKKKEEKHCLINKLISFNINEHDNLINIVDDFDNFSKKIDLISANDIYNANF